MFDPDYDGLDLVLLEQVAYADWMLALKETPLPDDMSKKEIASMGEVSTRAMIRAIRDSFKPGVAASFIEGIRAGLVSKEN
jgi:hypothetical protein